MACILLFSLLSLLFLLINTSHGKYVEGELNTLQDWEFITRFCFLSKKGTLRFTFEYPITYGPQHILLYYDTADQWDAVYKSDKTCNERLAVLDISNNQIINLTTSYGLSGCTITGAGQYVCNGGRIFRSSRERWWFIAVSRCDRDPTDTCKQKLTPLSSSQNIQLTTSNIASGCLNKEIDGVWKYLCKGGRVFRSSRERWWYITVGRCEPNASDTCAEKESVLDPLNNQIIYLTTHYTLSGCVISKIDGVDKYVCNGGRRFSSARERWWFIAVSRCDPSSSPPIGISLKYKIHMTNGDIDDYLHREYSADEFYILPIDIAFLIAYVILCILSIICAVLLRNRQLWHTTYKMYMVSVFLWTFYLFLMCIGYGIYGNDGLEWKLRSTKYAARAFESVSTMIFLLMLILIGKGYSITRGKLSTASTIKVSVFMTLFAIVYVVIFIWEAIIFDPGLVLYLYESPPGYALIAMRIIGFIWFCYAIFFTLKHYPEKGTFYYPLFVFYTLWFWAGPLVIVVAMTSIAPWSREKTVTGVENFVAFIGHIFFLVLTRPSAANKNFPYHVRTTQIGILQNVPHQLGTGAPDDQNYGGHAYAVSNPMQGSSSGPDLTSMFTTSRTTSDKQREAETSLDNAGMGNGIGNGTAYVPPPAYNSFQQPRMVQSMNRTSRLNSSAHLIGNAEDVDEVDEFPAPAVGEEPSAPPPSYEDMFRARGSISQ